MSAENKPYHMDDVEIKRVIDEKGFVHLYISRGGHTHHICITPTGKMCGVVSKG
jgi:hypothetical protein